MDRRQFIGTTTASIAAMSGASAQEAPRRKPNILFLMTDQHRGDCLGAVGNTAIHTPNLDRLAHEGACFRHAYTATPSCTPARAGLLTGWAPWRHGMLGYSRVAEHYPNELPRMIREQGYYTAGIGKMHWHPQRNLHGFHETLLDESGRVESEGFISDYRKWFRKVAPGKNPDETGIGWNDYRSGVYELPEELHPTRWMGDTATSFIDKYNHEEPFLLKVSFARPHSPYDPPKRFWDMYEGVEMPAPHMGNWAERNAMRGQNLKDDAPRGDLGPQQPLLSRRGYYGSVTFIDEQIGRILQALERRGMLEDTLILFTADHGDMLGDHHLWRKTYGYEGSARIPMIIRCPEWMGRVGRGVYLDQPVELRDVLPTFLDATGAEVDESRFDGRSMLNLARGQYEGWRETIDMEHSTCYWRENQWTGLTDGKYKYIYYGPTGEQELFDMQNDPGEERDLSGDPSKASLVQEWRDRMIAHLSERGEPYVENGDLGLRPEPMLRGVNYPRG